MTFFVAMLNDADSLQSHSSVERASLLGAVRCHKIVTTGTESMSGELLKAAIDEDRRNGLIPFYVTTCLQIAC